MGFAGLEVALGESLRGHEGEDRTGHYWGLYTHCPTARPFSLRQGETQHLEAVKAAPRTGMWAGQTGNIQEKLGKP